MIVDPPPRHAAKIALIHFLLAYANRLEILGHLGGPQRNSQEQ